MKDEHFRIFEILLLFTKVCSTDNFLSHTMISIIFWDFLIVEQIFRSPQVKRSVIIGIKLVYTSCLVLSPPVEMKILSALEKSSEK